MDRLFPVHPARAWKCTVILFGQCTVNSVRGIPVCSAELGTCGYSHHQEKNSSLRTSASSNLVSNSIDMAGPKCVFWGLGSTIAFTRTSLKALRKERIAKKNFAATLAVTFTTCRGSWLTKNSGHGGKWKYTTSKVGPQSFVNNQPLLRKYMTAFAWA